MTTTDAEKWLPASVTLNLVAKHLNDEEQAKRTIADWLQLGALTAFAGWKCQQTDEGDIPDEPEWDPPKNLIGIVRSAKSECMLVVEYEFWQNCIDWARCTKGWNWSDGIFWTLHHQHASPSSLTMQDTEFSVLRSVVGEVAFNTKNVLLLLRSLTRPEKPRGRKRKDEDWADWIAEVVIVVRDTKTKLTPTMIKNQVASQLLRREKIPLSDDQTNDVARALAARLLAQSDQDS